jgi:hypothetical protein
VRALIHLVPRSGAGDRFRARVADCVAALRERAMRQGLAVNALHRLERDAFGQRTPFRAGIEVWEGRPDESRVGFEQGGEGDRSPDAWIDRLDTVLGDLGAPLDDVAHPDASTLLCGRDVVFVPARRSPVRYQYLMRRNASFTNAAYLDYYRSKHSRFGIETPGAPGYVQLHVDRDASRRAAARAGLGERVRAPSRVAGSVPARDLGFGLRGRADRRRRGLRGSRELARSLLCGRLECLSVVRARAEHDRRRQLLEQRRSDLRVHAVSQRERGRSERPEPADQPEGRLRGRPGGRAAEPELYRELPRSREVAPRRLPLRELG